jgi:hypothetical protein
MQNNVKMPARARARWSAALEGLLADPELITKVIAALGKIPSPDVVDRYFNDHSKHMKKIRRQRRKMNGR